MSATISDLSHQLQKALQARQFHAAVGLLRQVLALDPHNAAVHFNLGAVLGQIGDWDASVASYDRAIARRVQLPPGQLAQTYFNRGLALTRLNRLEAALESYERAIAAQPAYADAHFNRGNVLYALKRLDAAVASYDLAIVHRPAHAAAYCNRANVRSELGQLDAAIGDFDHAIALNPGDSIAYYSRGVALKELNRLGEAVASYTRAIALKPDFAAAYCNRGVVQKDLDDWQAALSDFDRAIALDAQLAEAYCNKATALAGMGQVHAAIDNFDKAITLKGDYPRAEFSRATTWLLGGDYERGWAAYESRWRADSAVGVLERRSFDTPAWSASAIGGRSGTVLLYAEQGLGDTVQFVRYATLVAQLGARVVLEVPPVLEKLLATVQGVSQVITTGRGAAPLPIDYHCPLLSLPLEFKTTLRDIPAPRRYLHSCVERVEFWKQKIGNLDAKLKVGLVWSGGSRPGQPEAWPALRRRNIPLDALRSLRHPDIQFFSLQVGRPAADELASSTLRDWVIDHTDCLGDFSETAAFIENLDLVIAVDTSTAHVAGALGKPVWILNRFDTCWRWLLARNDSPWYPSATLYRQSSPGDWAGTVERVRADLFQLLG